MNPYARKLSKVMLFLLIPYIFVFTGCSSQKTEAEIPHLQKNGDSTQLIVDGKPYVMLGGELHNSSATSLEYILSTGKITIRS